MSSAAPDTRSETTDGGHALLVSLQQRSCIQALDLRDVCRLCITRKELSRKVTETLVVDNSFNLRQLLQSALRQASAAVEPNVSQHVSAVQWLLSQAILPAQLMVEDNSKWISIPKIPVAMVELLISAGARISYQQLVAAARSQVEGVHVWVTAQQRLGMLNDLPCTVEALCRAGNGGNWTFVHHEYPGLLADLALDQLVDLLYISLNMLQAGTSSALKYIIHHVVRALAGRHIDRDSAMQLCKAAMQICNTRAVRMDLADRCIGSVLELQRLTDLPTPAVHDLLLLALQLGVPASRWHKMCENCQTVQFTDTQSQAILAAAVEAALQHANRQTKQFAYLTACSRLVGVLSDNADSDFVGRLLCAAVASVGNSGDDHGGIKMRVLLTALPAVVSKERAEVIAEALQAVHDSSTIRTLLQPEKVPSVGEVRPSAALQALKAAVAMNDADGLSWLLELEGAADISAAEVAELINLAVVLDSSTLNFLCQLPAAGGVGLAAVLQALNAALDAGNADNLAWLVKLEGAAGISATEVAELINTALGSRHHQVVGLQASSSQVSQARQPLTHALPELRLVYFLCQLKESCNIPVDTLAGLLRKAVQHGDLLDIQTLILLPGTCQLERAFVRQLAIHLQKAPRLPGSVTKERALTRLQAILLSGCTMASR